jgi:hypothetical protein
MGHRQSKARDKKVHSMMNSGLVKLAMLSDFRDSNTHAVLEEKVTKKSHKEKQIASISNIDAGSSLNEEDDSVSQKIIDEKGWGIQVGAFSNYTKARNYALQIQNELTKKYSDKSIDIEAAEKGSAVVYRSKIIGFAQTEANEACKGLKKSNKSCIVVAVTKDEDLILAQHKY